MTRTTRFRHLHFAVVMMLLALSLLVAASPAVQVFAEIQATPVVESPVPAVVSPDVDYDPVTEIAQPEVVDFPNSETVVDSTATVETLDVQTPPVPENTPDDIDPVQSIEHEVVDVTPDVTETPAPRMVAPMAVTPEGSMSGCAQSSETISPGEQITAWCTYSLTVLPYTTVTGRVERPQLPVGYTAAISTSPGGTAGFHNGPGAIEISFPRANWLGQTQVRVYITIAAGIDTVPTQSFNSTFNTCMLITSNSCALFSGQHSSMRVTATFDSRQLVEGQQYTFSCTAPPKNQIGLGESAKYDCTVKSLPGLGDRSMRLDHIDWALPVVDGWQVTLSGQTLSGTSGRLVPGSLPTISSTTPHAFAVTFTPVGCPAISSQPNLVIKVHLTPVGQISGTSTSAGVPLAATFDAPKQETSARLIAIPGTVEADYSMTKRQDLSAGFTAEYTASGCKPWTGYAEMSEFTLASDAEVISVPVLESMTPGAPVIISGSINDVKPAEPNSNNAATTTLITGDAPGKKVVVEQDINLKYTVPANTTIGTYESTVTVNTTSAP